MRREGSLLASLEGEGQSELTASQAPHELRGEGCFGNTSHKKSFGWRARRSRAHGGAALPAASEGAAPANTSRACLRWGGRGSSFLGHRVPGSANAGDTSPWLRAKGATRLLAPCLCPGTLLARAGDRAGPSLAQKSPSKGRCTGLAETGGGNKKNPPPGAAPRHPGQASSTRRGCQAWAGRRMSRGSSQRCSSGGTGAAPALPKHRLLAGPAHQRSGGTAQAQNTPAGIGRAAAAAAGG